jgi:hypothetical protein
VVEVIFSVPETVVAPPIAIVFVELRVPETLRAPLVVRLLLWVRMAFVLTVTEMALDATFTVTALPPVVAMMALSFVPGVFAVVPLPPAHPVHVPVALQFPPAAVEVHVAERDSGAYTKPRSPASSQSGALRQFIPCPLREA